MNSKCDVVNGNPSCACLESYKGVPPYCRPECISNSDCSNRLACINEKCIDPCINACGENAKCSVSMHVANCYCVEGTVGNPFVSCRVQVLQEESKFNFRSSEQQSDLIIISTFNNLKRFSQIFK